jgi:hypothetical protein
MKVMQPCRVTRTYLQKIQAPPEEVFPLLCPVRETEWVRGWDPIVVYSHSGLAEPGWGTGVRLDHHGSRQRPISPGNH